MWLFICVGFEVISFKNTNSAKIQVGAKVSELLFSVYSHLSLDCQRNHHEMHKLSPNNVNSVKNELTVFWRNPLKNSIREKLRLSRIVREILFYSLRNLN